MTPAQIKQATETKDRFLADIIASVAPRLILEVAQGRDSRNLAVQALLETASKLLGQQLKMEDGGQQVYKDWIERMVKEIKRLCPDAPFVFAEEVDMRTKPSSN